MDENVDITEEKLLQFGFTQKQLQKIKSRIAKKNQCLEAGIQELAKYFIVVSKAFFSSIAVLFLMSFIKEMSEITVIGLAIMIALCMIIIETSPILAFKSWRYWKATGKKHFNYNYKPVEKNNVNVTEEQLLQSGFTARDVSIILQNNEKFGGNLDDAIKVLVRFFWLFVIVTLFCTIVFILLLLHSHPVEIFSGGIALLFVTGVMLWILPVRLSYKAWCYRKEKHR